MPPVDGHGRAEPAFEAIRSWAAAATELRYLAAAERLVDALDGTSA